MRGSVSVEYVFIILAFALIYLSFVTYYISEAAFFGDVKRLIEAKTEMARLAAAGYFVSTSEEANVALVIKDFNGTFEISPLRADVNVSGSYNACGGRTCSVSFPYSFDISSGMRPGLHYVVKEGGEVKVK